jgi:predicted Zn-dependent protease
MSNSSADPSKPNNDEPGRKTLRERNASLRPLRTIFLVGIAASPLIALLFTYAFLQRPTTSTDPESAAQAKPSESQSPDDQPVEKPAPAISPTPRPSTVALPSIAAPATAEQLQQESEAAARDLQSRYPDLAEGLHVVALLHAQLRQTTEAEKIWRKCIELSPRRPEYYVNLATTQIERGESAAAIATLRQSLAAGCKSEAIDYHLALALMKVGDCAEAEKILKPAVGQYPDSADCWLALGESQLKLGNAADAEASLRKAIALDASSATAYFALGNACARQGKTQEAAQFRDAFAKLKDKQPIAAPERFQVLSADEWRRTAVAIFSEAAMVHASQGDVLESERLLLRALALNPMNAAACSALAGLYRRAGMLPEERVARRRLLDLEPGNAARYIELADVSSRQGEQELAEATMKLAIANHPDASVLYASLAQWLVQWGKADKARWYAQEAVRREPTADGFRLLAATCRLTGDQASADAATAESEKLNKEPEKPGSQPPSSQEDPASPPKAR